MTLELDTNMCVLLGGFRGAHPRDRREYNPCCPRSVALHLLHSRHSPDWPAYGGERLESLKDLFQESGDFSLEDAIFDATLVLLAPLK